MAMYSEKFSINMDDALNSAKMSKTLEGSIMSETVITKTCCWWPEGNNYEDEWRTQCGGLFTLTCDTPTEHGMKFCCYCGKKLVAVHYEPESEEE